MLTAVANQQTLLSNVVCAVKRKRFPKTL